MLFPMGTDAPVYHLPRATIGLILLNIVCFFVAPPDRTLAFLEEDGTQIVSDSTRYETYALTLGDGLHPIQWITHNFLHTSLTHLIGNMLFLWAFGIVVEGKLGPVRFLAVYLLIGTMHGALTQTLYLWSDLGGVPAAGASAVIFGLLAICMIWAPHNEVQCYWVFFWGRLSIHQIDLRYTWIAAFYFAQQILNLALSGLTGRAVVSELGHLSGAFWGVLIGFGMLKLRWVDCEGWDILSVWGKNRKLASDWKRREERLDRLNGVVRPSGTREKKAKAKTKTSEKPATPTPQDRASSAQARVQKLIAMGDFASAVEAYDRFARTIAGWPEARDLLAIIKEMHAANAESESLPLMRDFCRKYPDEASRMKLKVAQVLIRDRQKPTAALRVLREIPDGALSGNFEVARGQLIAQAERMREHGMIELEGED